MSNYRFITACNTKKTYYEFIRPWINHHIKLFPNSDIKCILVSEEIPEELKDLSNHLILFKPIENISTAYQSQLVRLVYPVLLDDALNIICDIDLFAMSKEILTIFDKIPNKEKSFINYGKLSMRQCEIDKEFAMCYSILSNQVIEEKLEVKTSEDIILFLKNNYTNQDNVYGYEWYGDQKLLYNIFREYEWLVKLERPNNDRLDRDLYDYKNLLVKNIIETNCIADLHAARPYSEHKERIDTTLSYCDYPEEIKII